jgi:hypothetical protein
MNEKQRLDLIREVLTKVIANTESMEGIGDEVAYLSHAIAAQIYIDWHFDRSKQVRDLFLELFPANHNVWKFIKL